MLVSGHLSPQAYESLSKRWGLAVHVPELIITPTVALNFERVGIRLSFS